MINSFALLPCLHSATTTKKTASILANSTLVSYHYPKGKFVRTSQNISFFVGVGILDCTHCGLCRYMPTFRKNTLYVLSLKMERVFFFRKFGFCLQKSNTFILENLKFRTGLQYFFISRITKSIIKYNLGLFIQFYTSMYIQ